LLLILIESGLRVGEITRLDRNTFRMVASTSEDNSKVTLGTGEVLLSKQARCRSFWVGPDSVTAVAEYLAKDRAEDDEPALFVTKQGKRVTTAAISATVARCCKGAGIELIGCFRFRQTLALNLANAGVPYLAMLKLLGYSNPKSALRFFPDHREDHPSPGIFRRLLGFLKGK
jgi:site-specific recombinase XerC